LSHSPEKEKRRRGKSERGEDCVLYKLASVANGGKVKTRIKGTR